MDLINVEKELIEGNINFYFSHITFNGIAVTTQHSFLIRKEENYCHSFFILEKI